jgi:hypothetical protein
MRYTCPCEQWVEREELAQELEVLKEAVSI